MFRRLSQILLLLLLSGTCRAAAQTQDTDTVQSPDFVYLLNADEIRFEKHINPDAQRLIGNVIFRHDSMYMYCDSALFFQEKNSFNAYHNVRMEQGDTLFLYGDSLFYDGGSRLLRVRDNVRLENTGMALLTDSLNYDRETGLAWFFRGGTLIDGESTLISQYGQYDTNSKMATFMDGVTMESPDYRLESDAIDYNTELHEAFLTCPTKIESDETVISSSRGSYMTETGSAVLLDRSTVNSSDETAFTADSIIYNKVDQYVYGFGSAVINDLKDKMDVMGDYLYYDRNIDSAVVSGNALLVGYSGGDSLFAHADTFKLVTQYNESRDSLVERQVKAYRKVRLFRNDIQAVADSLEYRMSDTTVTLFMDPILWSQDQQVLGEKIVIHLNDSTIDRADVLGQALFVQSIDTIHYNQIAGREMAARFRDGQLDNAQVKGNVECIFYAQEADSTMIGMNTTTATLMNIHFRNGAVEHLKIDGKSNGIMYPMSQLDKKIMYLASFNWFEFIRPISREDVFVWRGKQKDQQLKKNAMSKPVPLPKLNK